MRRKLKTPFLVGGICIAVIVVIAFVLLYIFASQKTQAATPDEATVVTTEAATPNYDQSIFSTENQKTTTIAEPKSLEQIILDEGLKVDAKGNVTDADGNKYKTDFGKIKLVYNNQLYTIDISLIKAVTTPITATAAPATRPNSSSTSSNSKSTTSSSKTNNNTNNNDNSNNNQTANNNQNNVSPPVVEQTPAPVIQKPTVSLNNNNSSISPTSNIRLNYKSMTVNKGDVFSLTLSNAGNSVYWRTTNSAIATVYEKDGNQCSFKALSKGSTTIIANYNGVNYSCSITIQ